MDLSCVAIYVFAHNPHPTLYMYIYNVFLQAHSLLSLAAFCSLLKELFRLKYIFALSWRSEMKASSKTFIQFLTSVLFCFVLQPIVLTVFFVGLLVCPKNMQHLQNSNAQDASNY